MKYSVILALVGATSAVKLSWDTVKTEWNNDNPHPGYNANHDDFEGSEGLGSYDRVVPAHLGGPGSGDDMFLWSMINTYALEKATPTGEPTGNFVFRPMQARMAAQEILGTHMNLHGAEAQAYLDKYFDKTFAHFDTANAGEIEAERMSGFFRYLTGNMQIDLH